MFSIYITPLLVLIVKQTNCNFNFITITPQEENDFFESWNNNHFWVDTSFWIGTLCTFKDDYKKGVEFSITIPVSYKLSGANDGIRYIDSVGGQTFCEQFKTRAHYTKDSVEYLRMEDYLMTPQNQHSQWGNIQVKAVICEFTFVEQINQQKCTVKYKWIISPMSKNRYCKLFAANEKQTVFQIQQCYKMPTGVWGKMVGLANKIA